MCKQSFLGFFTSVNTHDSSKYSHLATPHSVAALTREHSSKYHLDYLTGLIARWETEDTVLPSTMRKQKFKCHNVLSHLNREGNLCFETFSHFKTESKFSQKEEICFGDVEVHGSLVYTEVQNEEGAHRAGKRDSLQRNRTRTHGPGMQGCHQEGHSSREWVKGTKERF